MTFLNYDWVAGTAEGVHFEATQRQLLADDATRKHAVELLQQHNARLAGGFLQIPDLYGRVIRSIGVSTVRENGQPQTQIKLKVADASSLASLVNPFCRIAATISASPVSSSNCLLKLVASSTNCSVT